MDTAFLSDWRFWAIVSAGLVFSALLSAMSWKAISAGMEGRPHAMPGRYSCIGCAWPILGFPLLVSYFGWLAALLTAGATFLVMHLAAKTGEARMLARIKQRSKDSASVGEAEEE